MIEKHIITNEKHLAVIAQKLTQTYKN